MSTGKIELSVGVVKYVDPNEIITEEEYNYIKNKVPELDGRVGIIEDEIEEINTSLEHNMNKKIIVNVSQFGAKGDGITNDTQAINDAINYVSTRGGQVVFDNKEYRVSKILVKSNVEIVGNNATLKQIDGVTSLDHILAFSAGVQNIKVSNINIDGNRVINKNIYIAGINFLTCSNITLENINVKNVSGDGIFFGYVGQLANNIKMKNVKVENSSRNEIVFSNCKNIVCDNFTIISNDAFSSTFEFEKHDTTEILENIHLNNFTVTTGIEPVKLLTNAKYGDMKNIKLSNITLTGEKSYISCMDFNNIEFENINAKHIEFTDCNNLIITKCKLNKLLVSQLNYTSKNVLISKNTLNDSNNFGLSLSKVEDVSVSENIIKDNTTSGVLISYECKNVKVNDNIITNNDYAVEFVSNTHDNIIIENNVTTGNKTGDFKNITVTKSLINNNTSTKHKYTFISPNGVGYHSLEYDNNYALTFGAFFHAKRLALTDKYNNGYDVIPNGSIYEDKTDGKLKYKNLSGEIHTLSN